MDASWKRLDCRILIDISPRFRSRLIHDSSNRHFFEKYMYLLTEKNNCVLKIAVAYYALCNFLGNVSCYIYTWLLKSITAVPLVVSFNEFKCLKFTGNYQLQLITW